MLINVFADMCKYNNIWLLHTVCLRIACECSASFGRGTKNAEPVISAEQL